MNKGLPFGQALFSIAFLCVKLGAAKSMISLIEDKLF